jgi:hypothetical protein
VNNTNGTIEAKDNWVTGMQIPYNNLKWQLIWKGIVKNSKPGKQPYRARLHDKNGNPLWIDGQVVDAIIAEIHDSIEPEAEESEDNLDINSAEISLILYSLQSLKRELLSYINRAGISRFKKQEAAATIKAIKALREKLATIQ